MLTGGGQGSLPVVAFLLELNDDLCIAAVATEHARHGAQGFKLSVSLVSHGNKTKLAKEICEPPKPCVHSAAATESQCH